MEAMYGCNVDPEKDPYVVIAKKAMRAIATVADGAYLVDSLPMRE